MKKTVKRNFKEAAGMIVGRIERVFHAKATDVWHSEIGSVITFETPRFFDDFNASLEAAVCIADSKKRGLIKDGFVNCEGNNMFVRLI